MCASISIFISCPWISDLEIYWKFLYKFTEMLSIVSQFARPVWHVSELHSRTFAAILKTSTAFKLLRYKFQNGSTKSWQFLLSPILFVQFKAQIMTRITRCNDSDTTEFLIFQLQMDQNDEGYLLVEYETSHCDLRMIYRHGVPFVLVNIPFFVSPCFLRARVSFSLVCIHNYLHKKRKLNSKTNTSICFIQQ